MKEDSQVPNVFPVLRSKEQAKQTYNRISRYYDFLTVPFERKYTKMALSNLNIKTGESVLEIGFGTGHALYNIAELVGQDGKVYGIDISNKMKQIAQRRLEKAGLMKRVKLYCGDAAQLPYMDNTFNAVFMSFVLELFDTPEIPIVTNEIKRVLTPHGRLGIISMSKENGHSMLLRVYEWLHKKLPNYVDCRPIFLERVIKDSGLNITYQSKVRLLSLPLEIMIAEK